MKQLPLFILFLIILLTACTSVSKREAEETASGFLSERVKFFTRSENTSELNPQNIEVISSYEEGNSWIVLLHIESTLNGSIKKNDVSVEVSKKTGLVTKLNGQNVI